MRISEKTIEINFCAQFDPGGGRRPFWFGLTQEQEKRAGFDVMSRVAGRFFVLQFKASAHVLRTGERRFHAPHHQLLALQDRCRATRDVVYVLPEFGTSTELRRIRFDLVDHCWLLNVADIPSIPDPTRQDGAPRKDGKHYLDLDPTSGWVTIRSDPVPVRAFRAEDRRALPALSFDTGEPSPRLQFESFRDFSIFAKSIGSKAMGLFVAD